MKPIVFDQDDRCWYYGDQRLWDGAEVTVKLVEADIKGVVSLSTVSRGRWWLSVPCKSETGTFNIFIALRDGMLVELKDKERG